MRRPLLLAPATLTIAGCTGLQNPPEVQGPTRVLHAVSLAGCVCTLDVSSGVLKAVGAGPLTPALNGVAFGLDFNPAADRIRVVSDTGQNLRLHPDTGAVAAVET
jgi:hypothetical protein